MSNLSKLAVPIQSKGRFFKEIKTNLRNDFQRDRDRIIHSTAFRRLKHKTQVFVNTSGDHFRTRITHSLEVSQIARTLAKFFNLNEDLSETLSLAHDLGHTPFGHAGEESLNICMKNYGGFDHNIQTLRVITLLENRYYKFKGLNLSFETIDGLIKHNGPVKNLTKFNRILGKNFFKKKIKFSLNSSLEAQLASISDDIAYNSHDLEDGLKSNLFKLKDLKKIPVLDKIIIKHIKKTKKYSIDLIIRQIIREIINEMVSDVILTTHKNIKKYKIKNLNDIYNTKFQLVTFSNKMKIFDIKIKKFLRQKMYFHKKVNSKTNYGRKVITKLFKSIRRNPKKFIDIKKYNNSNFERIICDYIAGMTDRYAINLYNQIK
ncbi:deoxyguanosinetriphosphate triphosphohydrolase [Pelagibacterales bacterium SAG-MED28]|nr:deoxyguanosinetriphosphate triphosphohydrolase [Pelagibacterales bacterium SAG-MED28]